MVVVRFGHMTEIEIDTETGKSRVIKQYSYPIGKGSKQAKPEQKEIVTEQGGTYEL
jgi:hypothetical protein